MSDTRLAAARALATGIVHPGQETLLAGLEPGLWQVTPTSAGPVLALAGDLHLHAVELAGLPVTRLSPTQARWSLQLAEPVHKRPAPWDSHKRAFLPSAVPESAPKRPAAASRYPNIGLPRNAAGRIFCVPSRPRSGQEGAADRRIRTR